jgi:hypothetical protein
MASIILITIGFIDYLVKLNKLTRVMFCSVVAGKKRGVFFPTRKAQGVRWEVIGRKILKVASRARAKAHLKLLKQSPALQTAGARRTCLL